MKMNDLILIAAVDRNWGIGKNGMLLFRLRRDMERFRALTSGGVVIMGRRTLDSLPDGKPLKNRENIVMTRDGDFNRAGVTVCRSAAELEKAAGTGRKVFVAGGGEIYRLLLPYCSEAYITRIDAEAEADTYMVNLDADAEWSMTEESEEFSENGIPFRFCVYERIRNRRGSE